MKGLLQWFNRAHSKTGRLWQKTISASIDLSPVRAGMVKDPADYRWSSYGKAIEGGSKGNGKAARTVWVRALRAQQGMGADADLWAAGVHVKEIGNGPEGDIPIQFCGRKTGHGVKPACHVIA